MAKKAKKLRAEKYDEKLSIDGSFEDVIKVSVIPMPKPKPPKEPTKKPPKKK